MNELKKQDLLREKTMLISLLLSAPAPIVTGIPALTSHSPTQIADFLRRTAELVALFVSWWVYRKLQRNMVNDSTFRYRMERNANLTVAGAMLCSGLAMFVVGVTRLFVYKPSGNVVMGLVIAVLGVLTNSWFWWRYRKMTNENFDSVVAGQQRLYRAKTYVDMCVVTALTSVTFASEQLITKYIDVFGCLIVAAYLLYTGWDMIQKKREKKDTSPADSSEVN